MNTSSIAGPEVLFLIHPGSACSSADFNIGRFEARAARLGLCRELAAWTGDLVVIDGELSDDLSRFPELHAAITAALGRLKGQGFRARRLIGDDPQHLQCIREEVATWSTEQMRSTCTVSGAWYHPDDGQGCVGSSVDVLRALGLSAFVSDCAVRLDNGEVDPEDEADALACGNEDDDMVDLDDGDRSSDGPAMDAG